MNFFCSQGLIFILAVFSFGNFQSSVAQNSTLTTTARIQNVVTNEFLSVLATRNVPYVAEQLIVSRNNWRLNWGNGNRQGTAIEGQLNPSSPPSYLSKDGSDITLLPFANSTTWVFSPIYINEEYVNYYLIKSVPQSDNLCIKVNDYNEAVMVVLSNCSTLADSALNRQLFRIMM